MIANLLVSLRAFLEGLGSSHFRVVTRAVLALALRVRLRRLKSPILSRLVAQRRRAKSVVSTRLPDCQPKDPGNPLLHPCSKSPPNRPKGAPRRGLHRQAVRLTSALLTLLTPALCLAQASPFQTGATALQTNLLTLLTPVAVILVIALGVAAMVNRISWAWCIAAIAGIAISFGAPQIVTWIRGMFAV